MTIIYNENFDATSVGSLPSGWGTVDGSAWAVTNANSVSSPNALLGPVTGGNGKQIIYTGQGAMADMEVRFDVGNTAAGFVAPFLRLSADGQNGYLLLPEFEGSLNSTWNLYKLVTGSFTQMQSFTPSGLTGNISVRARIQGSNIYLKLWSYGTSEPSGWTFAATDSSISAVGYPGFRYQYAGGSTGGAVLDNFTLDNLSGLAISPTSVVAGSIGNSITLTGTSTGWSSGTPGAPTFTASGGTITAQTVASAASATITFTAPSSAGTVTITDPSTGATASLSVTAAATDFTVTPSNQNTTAGSATGAYSVQPNGALSASVTVALSDGGLGGVFKNSGGTTITSLTFTTNAVQTFTYTPSGSASLGAITLTAQASGSLTTNHNVTCTVQAGPTTIAVTNGALFWSPGNWDHLTPGTFGVPVDTMQATAPGAFLKFNVSGTVNLSLNIDNATNSGFAAGNMPIIRYSIDGATFTDAQLSPSQTSFVLSSNLSTGTHGVEVYFKASSLSLSVGDVAGSSGVSPTNVLRIKGVVIDSGASVAAPTLLPKRMLIFGDSLTQGRSVNADGSDDATQSYAPLVARALGAELGQLGYGGQGWEAVGGSNAPAFKTFYATYSAGRNRSFSGLDYVMVVHGGNDARMPTPPSGATIQADCQAWLTAMRTACGSSTVIFVAVEAMGSYASDLAAAVTAYKASSGDTKVYLLDPRSLLPPGVFTLVFGGSTQWTYDGVHPLIYGQARIGAVYAGLACTAVSSSAVAGVRRVGFSGGFV